jgi:hypothetical protein
MHTSEIISTHPEARGVANPALVACIEACFDCAPACTSCADACLSEDDVTTLRTCIRLDLDCTDICLTTGRMISRRTGVEEPALKRILETCAEACRECAVECERHAEHHVHCRVCAEACRRCEQVCGSTARSITPAVH